VQRPWIVDRGRNAVGVQGRLHPVSGCGVGQQDGVDRPGAALSGTRFRVVHGVAEPLVADPGAALAGRVEAMARLQDSGNGRVK
jgi:hypothetical protein